MIIRSQDKTKIVNFENLRAIKIEDLEFSEKGEKIIRGYGSASFLSLGEYSTEEKAIKVLDMIQDKYCMTNASNCMMAGTMRSLLEVTKVIQDKTIKAHRDLYAFEMPADNEVYV